MKNALSGSGVLTTGCNYPANNSLKLTGPAAAYRSLRRQTRLARQLSSRPLGGRPASSLAKEPTRGVLGPTEAQPPR